MLATYSSPQNTDQHFSLLYQLPADSPSLFTATATSNTCAQKPTFPDL